MNLHPKRRRSAEFRRGPAGAVVGVVTNITDPLEQGRVKVRFPWNHDDLESDWCRIAQPYAGGGRGTFLIPEIGDEVVCIFDKSDKTVVYVIGGLWNGTDKVPPPGNADGANNAKVFRTRVGHQLIFSDEDGAAKITLTDGKGERHIVIDMANDSITITAAPGSISFAAPKSKISIEAKTLSINASKDATWSVGGNLSDNAKVRNETVGGPDTLNVGQTWNVGSGSVGLSATSSSVNVGLVTASVSGSVSMSCSGERKITSDEVKRTAKSETATMGQLEMHARETVALVSNGPITIQAQQQQIQAPDIKVDTSAVVSVMGGLITMQGKAGIVAKAETISLC